MGPRVFLLRKKEQPLELVFQPQEVSYAFIEGIFVENHACRSHRGHG